jgi:hypothetical protein
MVYKMSQQLGLEVNKTYLSSYWQQRHTIIDEGVTEYGSEWVTSQWEDGSKTTHATSRRERDFLITEQCEPCQVRNAFKCNSCENHMY